MEHMHPFTGNIAAHHSRMQGSETKYHGDVDSGPPAALNIHKINIRTTIRGTEIEGTSVSKGQLE
jgi:hypothetical protein